MNDKPANNAAAFADMLVKTTNRVLEQNDEIESLRQQLAECQKAFETESRDIDLILNHFGMDINKFRTEGGFLNKYHIASELRHLQNVSEKLATVTAERDELVADAKRYRWFREVLPNVLFNSIDKEIEFRTTLTLRDWSWNGEQLDAAIDAALAKLGADKTGEV